MILSMDKNDIIEFLVKAKKKTYAGDGNVTTSSRPCSRDLKYFEDNFEYYDSYFGTDPFVGEELFGQVEK